jgi:hypothetical protein
MNNSGYIALLDPSIRNNEGQNSRNLGDVIIYDSVKEILADLFPGKEVKRISTHIPFSRKEKQVINNADFAITGGSNILTSDIRHFNRFRPVKTPGFYLYPGFKNVILLGNGWVTYQKKMSWATRHYYNKILHKNIFHSVRDVYSLNKLTEAGFQNVLHTSCPVTWKLDAGFQNRYNPGYKSALLMLTNYDCNPELDNKAIEMLLNADVNKIYFFPQSFEDTQYLKTLLAYKKNSSKFILLNHTLEEYYALLQSEKVNYVGNRLHGGIKALEYHCPSFIISIDSRAMEIKKSISLNVGERKNITLLENWINGSYTPPPLNIPVDNIKKWKEQFK